MDHLPNKQRVALGKAEEAKVFECVSKYLASRNWYLKEPNEYDDCYGKTDAWLFDRLKPDVEPSRCAIKIRESQSDILVAVYDPYYGINDSRTVLGRDVKFEYCLYITRSKDRKKLRLAFGSVIHKIISDMLEELKVRNYVIVAKTKPLISKRHPGCELRLHHDRYDGHPKILGFIPPSYLREGKEVIYIDYVE